MGSNESNVLYSPLKDKVELVLPKKMASLENLWVDKNSYWSLEPVIISKGHENLP